ncbi:hypothetical protein LCGC14_0677290 [marine sediment metagenome]|uniref:Uncharacterized protein n=1 Tax=marine sediment metagenome TaxID=412755 RepID=A0A0F9QPB1_9ZZZZ
MPNEYELDKQSNICNCNIRIIELYIHATEEYQWVLEQNGADLRVLNDSIQQAKKMLVGERTKLRELENVV